MQQLETKSVLTPIYISSFIFLFFFKKSFGNLTLYIFQSVAHQLLDLGEAAVLSGSVSLMEPVGFGARVGFSLDVRHRMRQNISWLQACWSGIIHCGSEHFRLPLSSAGWLRDYVTEAASHARALPRSRVKTARSCCERFVGGLKLLRFILGEAHVISEAA